MSAEDEPIDNVIIRTPTESDIPALKVLHTALFPVHYNHSFFERMVGEPGQRANFHTLVMVQDGALIGVCSCRFFFRDEYKYFGCLEKYRVKVAYIMTLGVKKAYRRRGYARKVLQEMAKLVKTYDCQQMNLHCLVSNTEALAFYEALNFKIVTKYEGYYNINQKKKDAYELRFDLTKNLVPRMSSSVVGILLDFLAWAFLHWCLILCCCCPLFQRKSKKKEDFKCV